MNVMKSRARLLKKIGEIPGFPGKFGPRSVVLSPKQLESLLIQLTDPKTRKGIKRGGVERPDKKIGPSERITHYRKLMSEYLEANFGLKVPISSLVCAKFYDTLADYLEK